MYLLLLDNVVYVIIEIITKRNEVSHPCRMTMNKLFIQKPTVHDITVWQPYIKSDQFFLTSVTMDNKIVYKKDFNKRKVVYMSNNISGGKFGS